MHMRFQFLKKMKEAKEKGKKSIEINVPPKEELHVLFSLEEQQVINFKFTFENSKVLILFL